MLSVFPQLEQGSHKKTSCLLSVFPQLEQGSHKKTSCLLSVFPQLKQGSHKENSSLVSVFSRLGHKEISALMSVFPQLGQGAHPSSLAVLDAALVDAEHLDHTDPVWIGLSVLDAGHQVHAQLSVAEKKKTTNLKKKNQIIALVIYVSQQQHFKPFLSTSHKSQKQFKLVFQRFTPLRWFCFYNKARHHHGE